MLAVPQRVKMCIAGSFQGVPYLVYHPAPVRIVLDYGVVPIRHPDLLIGPDVCKDGRHPLVGTGQEVFDDPFHFAVNAAITLKIDGMQDMGRWLRDQKRTVVLGRIPPARIDKGACRSRVPVPEVDLLQLPL